MTTYAFDTAAAVDEMVEAGIAESHAKVIVKQLAKVDESLATKSDLRELGTGFKYFVVKNTVATVIGIVALLKGLEYLGL